MSNKKSVRAAPRRPAASGWQAVGQHRPRPAPRRSWEPLSGPLTFSMGGSVAGTLVMKPGVVPGWPQVEAWRNDRYLVVVRRRPDGSPESLEIMPFQDAPLPPGHLWKDFQRIKDQLAGRETEAAELYPARSRLAEPPGVDAYFLWCLPPGERYPFGIDRDSVDPILRDLGLSDQDPAD